MCQAFVLLPLYAVTCREIRAVLLRSQEMVYRSFHSVFAGCSSRFQIQLLDSIMKVPTCGHCHAALVLKLFNSLCGFLIGLDLTLVRVSFFPQVQSIPIILLYSYAVIRLDFDDLTPYLCCHIGQSSKDNLSFQVDLIVVLIRQLSDDGCILFPLSGTLFRLLRQAVFRHGGVLLISLV